MHRSGKKKEFNARGVNTKDVITNDTESFLLTKEILINISNKISVSIGKRLSGSDIQQLVAFIKELPPDRFINKSNIFIVNQISDDFINRKKTILSIAKKENTLIDKFDDGTGLNEYMMDEINTIDKSESEYKRAALSLNIEPVIYEENIKKEDIITPDDFMRKVLSSLLPVKNLLSNDSIALLSNKIRTMIPELQTYDSINFSHNLVSCDSRNRLISHDIQNEYRWILNTTSKGGQLGDIRLKNTIKELFYMKINSFWLPIKNPVDINFGKIRMFFKNFWQASTVTEFLDSTESLASIYDYHFEFDIITIQTNRVFIKPSFDLYYFQKPISIFDDLVIEFRNPFSIIELDKDRDTFDATYSVVAGDPTLFTLASGVEHNLSTGDLVYILGFNSANTSINTTMNRLSGLTITRINNLQFTVEVDTNILSPGTLTGITILYGDQRLLFQLDFVGLEK